MWHNPKFGSVLANRGRTILVDYNSFLAHQSVLAKRVKQPKPPRIQVVLKRAYELKDRLAANPGLTRDALAKEVGLNPSHLTKLLRLADLAPEIQQHIFALPPSIHRDVATERRLRPIALITDHRKQVERFRELFDSTARARKTRPTLLTASSSVPF